MKERDHVIAASFKALECWAMLLNAHIALCQRVVQFLPPSMPSDPGKEPEDATRRNRHRV